MANECYLPPNLRGRKCGGAFLREVAGYLFVPEGTNEVTFADLSAMTAEAVTTAINDEPTKRAIPVNDIDDYTPEVADSKFQEHSSGRRSFISKGVWTLGGNVVGGDAALSDYIIQMNNMDWRVYPIGNAGFNYVVDATTKTILKGLKVAKGSFRPKYMPSNGTDNVEMAYFEFDIDKDTDYTLMRYSSYIALGYNLLNICEPLIDIDAISSSISSIGTESLTMTLKDDRGNGLSGFDDDTESFTLSNLTTECEVTITGITESTSVLGQYTVSYTTGVTAVDNLSMAISKDGFDSYGVALTGTAE